MLSDICSGSGSSDDKNGSGGKGRSSGSSGSGGRGGGFGKASSLETENGWIMRFRDPPDAYNISTKSYIYA